MLVASLKAPNPRTYPWCRRRNWNLVINAQTAKTLGLAVPDTLLAIADEVIE
jgi:hypothetical protein